MWPRPEKIGTMSCRILFQKICGDLRICLTFPEQSGPRRFRTSEPMEEQVGDAIEYVDILDTDSMKTVRLSKDECGFHTARVFLKKRMVKMDRDRSFFFLERVFEPSPFLSRTSPFQKLWRGGTFPGQIRDAVIALRKENCPI